jgi:hypothetical protein
MTDGVPYVKKDEHKDPKYGIGSLLRVRLRALLDLFR